MTRLSTSPGPYHDRGQIDRHQAAAHVAKLERTERTIDDVIHDEYLRDPYNAAFSSISILYGNFRILRELLSPPLVVVWVDRRRFSAATRNEIRSAKRHNRRHPPAARRVAGRLCHRENVLGMSRT